LKMKNKLCIQRIKDFRNENKIINVK
jgi:hypothetical protein